MTKDEFRILVEGALNDAIGKAMLYLRRELPKGNIRLISGEEELTHGWTASIDFLVSEMYFEKALIKPCGDLVVDSFDDSTTTIRVFISSHKPAPYSLNWQGGTGPFIKAINSNLIEEYSNSEFPIGWHGK